jgi:Ca2+-binding RTX toxin-like protein
MRLFQRLRQRHAGKPAQSLRKFEARVEQMEGRVVLTGGSGATIALQGSMIEILGTNLGDTGSVSLVHGSYEVKVSNSQGSDDDLFPASGVSSVEFVGGSGTNTFANATSLMGYLYGGSGSNTFTGGSGMDVLVASGSGLNVLNAGSGDEILIASGGGTNILNGGAGFDEMVSEAGSNTFNAGSGPSLIIAAGGQNVVNAGSGYATVYSFSSTDQINPNANTTVIKIGY